MRRILYWMTVVSMLICGLQMTEHHQVQVLPKNDAMLRLHVVAESDSAADQAQKLLVRDAVLQLLEADMQAVSSKEEAEALVQARMGEIICAAEETLLRNGCDASVRATVAVEQFPSITYNGQIVPKGEYLALRIVIGEGQGRNWWCVLFPPLCYADIQYDETMQIDPDAPQEVQIRWLFKEWINR